MPGGPPIQLINSFPPPTAIWRYARLARLALGARASLATIRIGNFDFNRIDPTESSVYGVHIFSTRMSSLLNFAFAELSFRRLTEVCERVQQNGGAVQYLAEDIRPWHSEGKLGVVIHGNPLATLETDEFYSFGTGYKLAVRGNLRKFNRIATALVQSDYVRKGLEDYGFDGPIKVVAPAVDPLFQPSSERVKARLRLNLPTDRKLVLSISTAEKRKNLKVLPQVFDLLPSEFKLVRVGPPVRGALSLRNLSDRDVADLYAICDVLLFPTLEEGFGLPAIEAFASGLPVVTSDISVMREVCGGAALLSDPLDPRALARAVAEASSHPQDLVERGYRRAKDFSIENLATGLASFFARLEARI